MYRNVIYVIVIILIVVAVAGGLVVLRNKSGGPPKNTGPTQQDRSSSSVEVDFTNNGFSTGALTILAGTTIKIKNSSGSDIEITSGNGGFKIERDKIYPFTLPTPGEYTYTEKKSNQKLLIITQ